MLSMLRAVLYRMAKSTLFLSFTVAIAACACLIPALCLLAPSLALSFDFGEMLAGMTILRIFGNTFLSGSFLGMMAAALAASLMASDFKTGYVKNLVQARGGRVSFVIAYVVAAAVASLWLAIVGFAVLVAGLAIVGQPFLLSSASDVLLCFAQVLVVLVAYCALALLVVVVTRSEVLGAVAGLFLGGGACEGALNLVASNIPWFPTEVRTFFDGYLNADLAQLASGMLTGTGSFLEGGVTLLAAAALAVLVARRRGLA